MCALAAGIVLCAYPGAAVGDDADPLMGIWKMNAAKSKFDPGPAPTSITTTFAAAGAGMKVTTEIVDPEGKTLHSEYTASYDGKDSPLTGSANADTITLKKIDAATLVRTDKKAGKVVATFTRKVSSDGKTLTVVHTGTDAKGQKINGTLVLDKQ